MGWKTYLPKPNGNLWEEGERVVYIQGSILKPEGKFQANIYQGEFRVDNGDTAEDGYIGIVWLLNINQMDMDFMIWLAMCGVGKWLLSTYLLCTLFQSGKVTKTLRDLTLVMILRIQYSESS
jgi:hypothetical protein